MFEDPTRLATRRALLYQPAMMNSHRANSTNRPAGFAVETVRALASSLLLLGLIGDRRVR